METNIVNSDVLQLRQDIIVRYKRSLEIITELVDEPGARLKERIVGDKPVRMYRGNVGMRLYNKIMDRESAYKSGDISAGAAKRLRKALDLFFLGTPGRWIVNPYSKYRQFFTGAFMTLTFPSNDLLDSKWVSKNILEVLLKRMERRFGKFKYVWKKEIQTKSRFQLHYHMILDVFVDKDWINRNWADILRKSGLLEEWDKKHGKKDPPATEVRSIRDKSMLKRYMRKYFLKKAGEVNLSEEQKSRLYGRWWNASNCLKVGKYVEIKAFDSFVWKLERMAEEGVVEIKDDESGYFTIYIFKKGRTIRDFLPGELYKRVLDYYRSIDNIDMAEYGFNYISVGEMYDYYNSYFYQGGAQINEYEVNAVENLF